ncbi:MAG: lamin tail domain-containing protein [Planctomycetes bacterium]|nr:lamin tail domain-containing protein [Planctomycetota bacterium]
MFKLFRGRILGLALCSAVTCFAAITQNTYAAPIVSDTFTYANGPLVGAAGSTWVSHGGTAGQIQVSSGKITLVQTTQSEDANLPFGSTLAGKAYAAFTLNVPSTSTSILNVYFAHFFQNTSTFRTRLWLLPPSGGCGGPPPVTGACCNGGSCTPNLTQTNCENGGGIYLGDGSVCGVDACTPGACCTGVDTCQSVISAQCITLGGSFQGAGAPCTPNPCGPIGACCSADFLTCNNNLTQPECAALDPTATWYEGQFCNLVCGPTGSCCELNGTCTLGVTEAQCAATNGRNWTEGAGSCTNCTAVVQANVIISEYYESAPLSRKAIEVYNPTGTTVSLDGHLLALYSNASVTPTSTFSLNGLSIPSLGVLVFINNAADDIPNFDEGTGIVAGGAVSFNGDDSVAILFIDENTVVDRFAVPGQQDSGPRGSDPYADSAWERKCFVTTGNDDFDACNFDAQKGCGAAGCPPGTNPPNLCTDGANYDQWIFEGRNLSGDNGHHTLGVHDCSGPLPTGGCCPALRGPGCTCLGNMNGDSAVNFADVPLFVAALLNNSLDVCADMNNSGADNGADVQAFVVAVIAQTPCNFDECTILTQSQCLALGGLYLGDDSDCTGNPCSPEASGACCTTSGCVDGLTPAECETAQGYYFGDNTSCGSQTCLTDTTSVIINEIRADQTGTDTSEYFELAGPAGTLLNGLTYVTIGDDTAGDGSMAIGSRSGVIERAISLTGHIIPADGRFLAVTGTFVLQGPSAGHIPDFVFDLNTGGGGVFENSDNVSHLLVADFTGAEDGLVDDDRDGVLNAVMPWAALRDWVSLVEMDPPTTEFDEWVYDFSAFNPNGAIIGPDGSIAPEHVYRNNPTLNTDGAGTPWQIGPIDPAVGDDTPGVPNVIQGACCNGGTCTIASRSTCEGGGGMYRGTGTDCTVNICIGACCDGQSCTQITQAACAAISGAVYIGDGASCTPNPCLTGCVNIAAARLVPDEDPVRVCGVVSSTIDTVGSGTLGSFQIQDTSGADGQSAITIFGATGTGAIITDILAQVVEGQEIELIGSREEFNGLSEIDSGATALQLVSTGAVVGVPPAITITAADFQDDAPNAEGYESEIVRVECVTFTAGNGTAQFDGGTAGTNYTVTSGALSFVVRLGTNSTTLQGAFIPVGPVNVTGIFSQFDSTDPRTGGYQLLIRKSEDLELNPPSCTVPTGGCCIENNCPIQTGADCANAAGSYLGNGTNCDGGCPSSNGACLIISEVVDGDRSGGTPKWVEITNTGSTNYLFPAGGLFIASNGSTTKTFTNLTGVTIPAGTSYVVCGNGSSGQSIFELTYSPIVADQYVSAVSGNGDDVYGIADDDLGTNILDVYGELGVDGTGMPWEYTDSVAVRNASANSGNGGVFNVAEWTITSINGANDTESTTLLQTLTTPKTHVFDPCEGGNPQCEDPPGTRTISRCDGVGDPACNVGQTYCSFFVDASSASIPPECARCTLIDGGIVCVPCTTSCPNGGMDMFKWQNFDGNGNDCFFEGTVFTPGGCQSAGTCFSPQGRFNQVSP